MNARLADAVARLEATETQMGPRVEVISAAELAKMELPEPRWAVRGLLPEGVVIVGGPPKAGKSWLCINIAYAVACGGRALGVPVQGGMAIYFALEDTRRRLQGRLRIITPPGGGPPERLLLATSLPTLDDRGIEWLGTFIAEHPDLRLVVIDTLARARRPRSRNGDPHAEDTRLIGQLQAIAAEHHLCILLVTHTRKRDVRHGEPDALESVLGTQAFLGAADAVLVLRRARMEREARLTITGRDVEERELALKFDPTAGTWSLLGDAAEVAATTTQKRLLEALRTAGGQAKVRDIAALAGLSESATKQACIRAVSAGVLTRTAPGVYAIHSVTTTPSIPYVSCVPSVPGVPVVPSVPSVPVVPSVPGVPVVPSVPEQAGTRVEQGVVPAEKRATTELIGGGGTKGTRGTQMRHVVEV